MTELTTANPGGPRTEPSQSRLLEMARSLDVFGRQAEKFLQQQLEDLQFAMEELEREKAAWRRQMDRESSQLARRWEEIREAGGGSDQGGPVDRRTQSRRTRAEKLARETREAPLRLLLQPGRASALQVGLIVFEMSKLNREMGGRGLRFELDEVRRPARGLFTRRTAGDTGEILELSVFSEQPLQARGQHVVMEVDITDRIENWIAFKSRLLQSQLIDDDLSAVYEKSRVSNDQSSAREILRDANRRVDDVDRNRHSNTCYSGAFQFVNTALDTVQQQVGRLEGCCERLTRDTDLKLHVTVHPVR